MKRGIARLVVPAFLLLIAPLAAEAQAPSKVWRIAVLTAGILRSDAPVRALEQRLAELGYVEGRNLVIDFRSAGAQIDRLPALAADLVAGRPDIFVAASTQGGMAAKNVTRTIPIVLAAVGPALVLLLGVFGLVSDEAAAWLAVGVGSLTLAIMGFRYARIASLGLLGTIVVVGANLSLALLIAALKVGVEH